MIKSQYIKVMMRAIRMERLMECNILLFSWVSVNVSCNNFLDSGSMSTTYHNILENKSFLCPRRESNLDQLVRSELFYPLNYEDKLYTMPNQIYHTYDEFKILTSFFNPKSA